MFMLYKNVYVHRIANTEILLLYFQRSKYIQTLFLLTAAQIKAAETKI